MRDLQEEIQEKLSQLDPQIELIALENPAPDSLRLYIDHPDGVNIELCERATRQLGDLLVDYSLEVSSPGAERPLTKPEHFRRFRGRRVRVRTEEELAGRRSFTGTIADADEEAVSVELEGGPVKIPHQSIRRSNLVPDIANTSEVGS
jgi:ribosome maturation factor RimP